MSELAADLIRNRIADLVEEKAELEKSLSFLTRGGITTSNKPSPARSQAPSGRRRGSQKAKRGERDAQIVADVKENPRTKASEIAKRLDIGPAQVHAKLKKLTGEGKIKKSANKTYTVSAAKTKQAKVAMGAYIPIDQELADASKLIDEERKDSNEIPINEAAVGTDLSKLR